MPIQEILATLTHSYKKLLGDLILNSQELLGPPPTKWACIGMGSMARGEMCPYSDLEFAFIIEKKTEKALIYFRTLSQFLELRIINCGETKFPIFAQIFGQGSIQASPTPGGFSMDSGGNTPLGKPGFYELIDTPEGLAQFQCEKWMDIDIIVTNALSSVTYIAGEKELLSNHLQAQQKHLDTTDGHFSFTGIAFREKLALKLIEGNLHEFKPDLSKDKQEISAFGIKKELYRPIQSLLGCLKLFCGLQSYSSHGMIQELLNKKILSPTGAKNLSQALQQILSLRFEAHTFYQNEEELLFHIEEKKPQDPHCLYLNDQYLKILHEIYMVLIPLHQCTEEFFATKDLNVFKKASLYDDSPQVQGEAFEKTLQYTKAQEAFQQAVSLNPNDIEAQLHLGEIESTMGKSKEALPRSLDSTRIGPAQIWGKPFYLWLPATTISALSMTTLANTTKPSSFTKKL